MTMGTVTRLFQLKAVAATRGPLQHAVITNTATEERIEVQFNPEEYTLQRENNYAQAAVPGASAPLLQFVHGKLKTLEMELFLDSYEAGTDVRDLTGRLAQLMDVDPRLHAPPVLLFTWGSLGFTCVLSRLGQRFILFHPDGKPARARLQASFSEYSNSQIEPKEVKRETADYSKLHVAGHGETLSAVAAQVYDNPALWRPIAIANAIDDPRQLQPGQRLHIPALPFRDPETGEVST
jgi:nucleoid-associated protein YgaU